MKILAVPNGERALELSRKLLGERGALGLELKDGKLLLRPPMSGAKHPIERAAWGAEMGRMVAVEKMELRGLLKVAEVVDG